LLCINSRASLVEVSKLCRYGEWAICKPNGREGPNLVLVGPFLEFRLNRAGALYWYTFSCCDAKDTYIFSLSRGCNKTCGQKTARLPTASGFMKPSSTLLCSLGDDIKSVSRESDFDHLFLKGSAFLLPRLQWEKFHIMLQTIPPPPRMDHLNCKSIFNFKIWNSIPQEKEHMDPAEKLCVFFFEKIILETNSSCIRLPFGAQLPDRCELWVLRSVSVSYPQKT